MKTLYAGILGIGLFVGGYFFGKTTNNEVRVGNEKIAFEQTDSTLTMKLENAGKSYQLTPIDGELYLGSAQHNMIGATKLAAYETQLKVKPYIDKLSSKVDSLEAQLQRCTK